MLLHSFVTLFFEGGGGNLQVNIEHELHEMLIK